VAEAGPARLQLREVVASEANTMSVVVPSLTTAKAQDTLFRFGLGAVEQSLALLRPGATLSSVDAVVLKTRPDVYLPQWLVRHAFELDYAVKPQYAARPFLYRVWVPFLDAVQPFYIADEAFSASLLDMWHLCWVPATLRPVPKTMGRGRFHVNRWLMPFLPWYPLLFAYRRNAYDITDKLMEPGAADPKHTGSQRAAAMQSSLVLDLAASQQLRPEVDAYLMQLLALWYRLIVTFFRVGGGATTGAAGSQGVILLVQGDATITNRGSYLELRGVRCSPGAFGFKPSASEQIMDHSLADCVPRGVDAAAGLARANKESLHFARPAFSAAFAELILQGQVPVDGVSERIAAAANAGFSPPMHFASVHGHVGALHYGRFEEELQTQWCADFAWASSLRWSEVCDNRRQQDDTAMHAPTLPVEYCCFPAALHCPAWLAWGTLNFVLQLFHSVIAMPNAAELNEEVEGCCHDTHCVSVLLGLCHARKDLRQQAFDDMCRREGLRAICTVASAAKKLPALWVPSTRQEWNRAVQVPLWRPAADALQV